MERVLLAAFYPVLLLVAVYWCAVHPLMDPDVWLHMAFGRYVLEHGAFPPGDIFSFTAAGREWISSGWAASVLLQAVYSALGAAGLVYLVFALIAATYLGIYATAVRAFGNRGSVVLVMLAALLGSYLRFTPRPEVFSQVFLAAVMLVLVVVMARAEERGLARVPRLLWAVPVLFALWPNFHAGFLVGLVPVGLCGLVWGVRWLKFRSRAALWTTAACGLGFLTWLLNPYGFGLALLSRKIKELPGVRQLVHEWQPMFGAQGPNLPPATLAGLAVLVTVAAVTMIRRRAEVRFWQVATAGIFAGLALYEIRHAALASLVLAIVILPHLGWLDRLMVRPRALLPAATVGATLLLCVLQYAGTLHFGSGWPRAVLDDSLLPHTATAYFQKNRPPANLYNTYGPGGYLLYHLGPETKVFMDGRNDVYDRQTWQDHWAIQDGVMSLDDAAAKYGVNSFLIYCKYNNENPANLANRLTARPEWKLVYFDDSYAGFVRETPHTAEWIRPRAFQILNPFALERLDEALRRPESRARALAEIQAAMERSGGSSKAHLFASYAARALGNAADEAHHLKQAQQRDPSVGIMPSPQMPK